MRFEQGFIEQVRESNDLIEVIGQHTELKGRGDQFMGLCPFPDHKEKSPSFSVSSTKQLYHCFGCKKSGNIYKFLETFNGFSFPESVEFLARRASIELPKTKGTKKQWDQQIREKSLYSKINRQAAFYYYKKLQAVPEGHPAKSFLKERGISNELAEEFRLGFASEAWDGLCKDMASRKVPIAALDKLGLIRKNKRGGYFDLFRDRVIYPIFSLNNDVVGFGGRVLGDGNPKYLNSVESSVFKKGKIFYGLNRSMHAISQADVAIVVEGYMDYLALYGAGVKNVVATLGTALTENHVRLLKRWTKNIILLFDGDQAGQTAAERSLIHFFTQGVSPRVYSLEGGEDPDDHIKKVGVEAFQSGLEKSKDLFLELLKKWKQGYKGVPSDKIRVFDRAQPFLLALGDGRLRDLYMDEVARELDEDRARIRNWLRRERSNQKPGRKRLGSQGLDNGDSDRGLGNESGQSLGGDPENTKEFQKLKLSGASTDEMLLIALSLYSEEALKTFIGEDLESFLIHPEVKSLYAEMSVIYGQSQNNFAKLSHLVIDRVENPEKILNLVNFSSVIEGENRVMPLVFDCIPRIKDRHLARKSSKLAEELKNNPSQEKLEQIMNIQKERISLKRLKKEAQGVD